MNQFMCPYCKTNFDLNYAENYKWQYINLNKDSDCPMCTHRSLISQIPSKLIVKQNVMDNQFINSKFVDLYKKIDSKFAGFFENLEEKQKQWTSESMRNLVDFMIAQEQEKENGVTKHS